MPQEQYCLLDETHPYLADLRKAWDDNIRAAFNNLPSINAVFEAAESKAR
jgi:putative proteasome-type protease